MRAVSLSAVLFGLAVLVPSVRAACYYSSSEFVEKCNDPRVCIARPDGGNASSCEADGSGVYYVVATLERDACMEWVHSQGGCSELDVPFFGCARLLDHQVAFLENGVVPQNEENVEPYGATFSYMNRWHQEGDRYIVPYEMTDVWTAEDLEAFYWSIRYMETKTAIRFRERTDEVDYISLIDGDWCSSYIGRTTGMQTMTLSSRGCRVRTVLVHEFMHALGFMHEHQRSDRDAYLTVNTTNIQPGYEHNFNKYPYLNYQTPYDLGSVMQYSTDSFAIDRNYDTMIPVLESDRQIINEHQASPSECDFFGMNSVYPGLHSAESCEPRSLISVCHQTGNCPYIGCNAYCEYSCDIVLHLGYCAMDQTSEDLAAVVNAIDNPTAAPTTTTTTTPSPPVATTSPAGGANPGVTTATVAQPEGNHPGIPGQENEEDQGDCYANVNKVKESYSQSP